MAKIGLIFNGVWSHYALATAPKYRDLYQLLYVHDLDAAAVQDLAALVVPFQSNQSVLTEKQAVIYDFLAAGKKVFVEGDSSTAWLDAQWEDRPVNNYWWVTDPTAPPVSATDYSHPVYQGLTPRQACWHTHGVYTRVPESAEILQTNSQGEVITWQTHAHGGTLLATTLDPIVEHGVQQITHLDHYVDRLTEWLCGVRPAPGRMSIDAAAYGPTARV
ncbi:hypothetical protein [Hymenobacter canadensis]|uniref:ThuA-like domain-containing protein n=1 Tax=Hymenobacter canadensis TaxID=2999067 RepID=A0ABY7LU69_9BACT|nr:hypothetical protein [Hymenobacter canadensis]WBA43541.1 hypothetical protein O3303_08220 [Hymenobacter canadensis]